MVPYAIVGLTPASANLVERQVGELGRLVDVWRHADEQALDGVKASPARLVLVGAEVDSPHGEDPTEAPTPVAELVREEALAVARALCSTGRVVALVDADPGPELLRRAMRLGCRDVVAPDDGTSLAELLEAAGGDSGALVGGTGGLVAVLGSHGGVGTTTVALALADLLARDSRQTVVVADMDEADRTLRAALDIPRGLTTRGLIKLAPSMDPVKVRGSLPRVPEGFWVLGQDEDTLKVPPLSAEEEPVVVPLLRRAFSTVIVDLGSTFNDLAWELVRDARLGVLVTTQDLMPLRTCRTRLHQLARLGLPPEALALVVNRYERNLSPTVADIQVQLGVPVTATLPLAPRRASAAMHQGVPLPEVAQGGRLASALSHLVEELTGAPPAGTGAPWWRLGRARAAGR